MIDALPLLLGPEGYQISRSVRLRSSASAYFNRSAYPVSGAGTKWTMSLWTKRGTIGTQTDLFSFVSTAGAAQQAGIQFDSNNAIRWWQYVSPSYAFQKVTTAVFRDPSAWYHLLFIYDTTLATSEDRLQIWVNGVRQTSFSTNTNPSQNLVTYYNNGTLYPYIGAENRNASSALSTFDGYLTEINFIDGQALTPSSFGETNPVTGVWQPKKYAGTYGTNGFYLNFSDPSAATAAAIGKDYSGNGNNWTPNNISVTAGVTYDSMLDVPTQWADGGNGRGNYCVMNPLDSGGGTFSNANLNTSVNAVSTASTVGTFAMTAGKWYWEITPDSASVFSPMIGVADQSAAAGSRSWPSANGWYYYATGQKYNANTGAAYGASYVAGDVIGVAYDADAGSLSFYKNGVSQGVAYSTGLLGKIIVPAFANGTSSNGQPYTANFGQRPFAYTPPTGFKALNTLNLPTPTILKGNQYFDATLWTGNGGSQTIANSGGMQPDFAWVKKRSGAENHELTDAVRGANLRLASNSTGAESAGGIAFNSTGLSLTGGYGTDNENGQTYVGWQWKEGATQGFDIVTYTGTGANRTVAHNLGVAPKMIITKGRDSVAGATNWKVYHASLGNTKNLNLNLTNAEAVSSTVWNNTSPTSSVFSLGTSGDVNANTATYVAYLFAEVAGFSKFGSYTGNGSADGPFVFCGFRPAFLLIKSTTDVESWVMIDAARNTFNVVSNSLLPNSSSAENLVTAARINTDFLSNGFKLRNAGDANPSITNKSGSTYIFAAFAENPFKNALAR